MVELVKSDFDEADVADLAKKVGKRLLRVDAPLAGLARASSGGDAAALARLRNPFAIEDDAGAFQTTGWLGAYTAAPSPVAVAAEKPAVWHPQADSTVTEPPNLCLIV